MLQHANMASYKIFKSNWSGHLPAFIKNFLQNCTFQVKVGEIIPDCCDQEAGVPQGSVFSTTLYNIKINRRNVFYTS